ncbi:hypothetical protein G6F55_004745 [Rhizopus delemar]|uniref:Protein transport protein SFT2 n=2 Tax=Rhizopus TaxID=4842 RepID=A0A9P6ZDL0_9FUNG|nr:hypothetical protein G6F55_004745 [Rhizopus delemar]KAG1552082.1 hypothetical protein G6F51_001453 [Rhizopus arrhizus]KAG1575626.1 hypothetical protein G6F50_000914 [Rhizopus delemar]KAG1633874.1 hypothetical protein G6F45_003134 [Rhizopus arrhizus]
MNRIIRQRENVTDSKSSELLTKSNNSSHTASKGAINTTIQLQKDRPVLSDKSNNNKKANATVLLNSSKIPGGNKIKVYGDDKPLIKDTQDNKREQEQEELVKDFFEDNKTRYKEKPEHEIAIVPILPIVVPDRMKHLFKKTTPISKQLSTKRSFEADDDEVEECRKKIRLYKEKYFAQDAPPLDFVVDDEAAEYDKQQELRAKNLMLHSKSLLQEVQGNDPMMVAEYADEIFHNLHLAETNNMADGDYATHTQHEITWNTRSILIDWVIETHYLFSLLPETLFLAVNIIDRFLSQRTVALGKLQLVGATALFVATKFEEMYCPALEQFLSTAGESIDEDELVRAECFILQVLDFRLCYANPMNFLRRLLAEDTTADVYTRILSKYFMEVCYVDHRLMNVRPSLMAAASLCLARKMLGQAKWTSDLVKLSGYTINDIKPVVEIILDYLSQPVTHEAFFKKWTSKRLSKASIFVRDWINRYYIGHSLRNFQLSRGNTISLPTNTNASKSAFQSLRESASNTFSNVSSTVQGYIPIGTNIEEEEEEPWYQLSRLERVMAFALCLALGIGCFCLSFFFLPLFLGKFAATFTLGSVLILVSVALLRGPWSHIKHMMSTERLPFTASYVGSMVLTLYAALGARNLILIIIFSALQIIALIWYVCSYIPGGVATLRYGTSYIGRRAASVLPI